MRIDCSPLKSLFIATVLLSCKTGDSGLKNTGHEIEAKDYPGTLLLEMKLVLEGGAVKHELCTGSFITPRYFLTAGHCTVDPLPDVKIIDREFTISAMKGSSFQLKSKIFIPHPDYPGQAKLKSAVVNWILVNFNPDQDIGLGYSDISLIDVGTAKHNFPLVKIADAIPKLGERVHIVGFGVDPILKGIAGIKRAGTNLIFRNDHGGLQTRVDEKNSGKADTTLFGGGDSGGVLYNDSGEAVGTVSITLWNENIFVQLQHPKVQNFLQRYVTSSK